MTYGGVDIFGSTAKMIGPSKKYRAMRRYLPGVNGFRVYRMGDDAKTWRVTGRITSTTRTGLAVAVAAAHAMIDGQLRTFVGDGETFTNTLLEAYEPGRIQRVQGNDAVVYTCTVDATLTQVAP